MSRAVCQSCWRVSWAYSPVEVMPGRCGSSVGLVLSGDSGKYYGRPNVSICCHKCPNVSMKSPSMDLWNYVWQNIISNPKKRYKKCSRLKPHEILMAHAMPWPRLSAPQVSLMRRTSSIFLATPAIFEGEERLQDGPLFGERISDLQMLWPSFSASNT